MGFRKAFCERHGCSDDQFETAVLRRSFPLWARPFASIALAFKPKLFTRELALIRRLGDARDESHVRQELEGYAYENARDRSFRTETLGWRLSRRRFLKVMRATLPRAERPAVKVAPEQL
jgi:hypothetical protein